jgi:ATP-dependent protease HslVU (ClpYQ) ATPase subunit
LDDVRFDPATLAGRSVEIDADHVDKRLAELSQNEDLPRYML